MRNNIIFNNGGRLTWNSSHLLKLAHGSGYCANLGFNKELSTPHGSIFLECVFPSDFWMLFFVLITGVLY